MRPLGFSGGLQYNMTAVQLMTMCEGDTQTPEKKIQPGFITMKQTPKVTQSPYELWLFLFCSFKNLHYEQEKHF